VGNGAEAGRSTIERAFFAGTAEYGRTSGWVDCGGGSERGAFAAHLTGPALGSYITSDGVGVSDLIAVAMSGGVDSSTVAALLKRDGYNIAGLTMQLWNQRRLPEVSTEAATGRCCSLDDAYDAPPVAE